MSNPSTLDYLVLERDTCRLRLQHAIDRLNRTFGKPSLSTIERFTRPLDWDEKFPTSPTAVDHTMHLHHAIAKGDWAATLMYRRLRPKPGLSTSSLHITLMMSNYIKVNGLTEIINWLEEFRQTVINEGPTAVMCGLSMLSVQQPSSCGCLQPEETWNPTDWWRLPSLIWMHANHGVINQAAWEIMATKPGLINRVRRALRDELAAGDKTIGDCPMVYGRHLAKGYARELLEGYIRAHPSEEWVSDTIEPLYLRPIITAT